MKLLWAGPWNLKSAIAKFGAGICEALDAAGVEVDVARTECGAAMALEPLVAKGRVFFASEMHAPELRCRYDVVVLNLGNNFAFHGGGVGLLSQAAPVGIIHDSWMGHFVDEWRNAAAEGWRIDSLLSDSDRSGLQALCALLSGAVVHSAHYAEAVSKACPGPVAVIPLALEFPAQEPVKLSGDRLVLATIGHANRNKRVDEVIRAFSGSARLRERFVYRVIGPVDDEERRYVMNLAATLGVSPPQFLGPVSDDELHAFLETVDVVSCLRHPIYEGGSASLILALQSGKPTLVSAHGAYVEVPDDVVMRCEPGREAAGLVSHLEWILQNPQAATEMGARASAFAFEHYAPRRYVDKLLPLLDSVGAAAPLFRTAQMMGRQAGWMGAEADDPLLGRIDAALNSLFASAGAPLR